MSKSLIGNTAEELKVEIGKTIALLGTLRDEFRVEIHLGRVEAEKRLRALARRAQKVSLASQRAVRASLRDLEAFRKAMRGNGARPQKVRPS